MSKSGIGNESSNAGDMQILAEHRNVWERHFDSPVYAIACSGELVASTSGAQVSIFYKSSGEEIHHFISESGGIIYAVSLSGDGEYVAAGGSNEKVTVWSLSSQSPTYVLSSSCGLRKCGLQTSCIMSLVWCSSRTIVCGGYDGKIRKWDLEGEKVLSNEDLFRVNAACEP